MNLTQLARELVRRGLELSYAQVFFAANNKRFEVTRLPNGSIYMSTDEIDAAEAFFRARKAAYHSRVN